MNALQLGILFWLLLAAAGLRLISNVKGEILNPWARGDASTQQQSTQQETL